MRAIAASAVLGAGTAVAAGAVLAGDARPSIELAHRIRNARAVPPSVPVHPLLAAARRVGA